jgi:hypothetical protein
MTRDPALAGSLFALLAKSGVESEFGTGGRAAWSRAEARRRRERPRRKADRMNRMNRISASGPGGILSILSKDDPPSGFGRVPFCASCKIRGGSPGGAVYAFPGERGRLDRIRRRPAGGIFPVKLFPLAGEQPNERTTDLPRRARARRVARISRIKPAQGAPPGAPSLQPPSTTPSQAPSGRCMHSRGSARALAYRGSRLAARIGILSCSRAGGLGE